MRPDDLPRLTDEERDALDAGYVAMAGVPAPSPRLCLNCKGSRVDPIEGYLCEYCEGTGRGNVSAPPPKSTKRAFFSRLASAITAIVIALGLSACSLTPTQKKWAGFAAGVHVVGAIAVHDPDRGKLLAPILTDPNLPCRPQPNGSCR